MCMVFYVSAYISRAVTRADFTRTSVTGQSNSIPIKFLHSAPKEVSILKTATLPGMI